MEKIKNNNNNFKGHIYHPCLIVATALYTSLIHQINGLIISIYVLRRPSLSFVVV